MIKFKLTLRDGGTEILSLPLTSRLHDFARHLFKNHAISAEILEVDAAVEWPFLG